MAIRGWIRVLKDEQQDTLTVWAVMADVVPDLSEMRIGWQLNDEGVGLESIFQNDFKILLWFALHIRCKVSCNLGA